MVAKCSHEPLGELIVRGETEHDDYVDASIVFIEEPNSNPYYQLATEGRVYVCKHCRAVYWEPEE